MSAIGRHFSDMPIQPDDVRFSFESKANLRSKDKTHLPSTNGVPQCVGKSDACIHLTAVRRRRQPSTVTFS